MESAASFPTSKTPSCGIWTCAALFSSATSLDYRDSIGDYYPTLSRKAGPELAVQDAMTFRQRHLKLGQILLWSP